MLIIILQWLGLLFTLDGCYVCKMTNNILAHNNVPLCSHSLMPNPWMCFCSILIWCWVGKIRILKYIFLNVLFIDVNLKKNQLFWVWITILIKTLKVKKKKTSKPWKLNDVLSMALIVWIGWKKNYNFLKAYERDGICH